MDKYFETEQGTKVNIIDHILEQLEKWPSLKIYIATDSQDQGKFTEYATCIVFRYGYRGAHYIFQMGKVPRVRDTYTRLYNESVRTVETAELIKESLPAVNIEALEFDYNDIKKHFSNKLVSAINGWVKGLGYRTVFKNRGDDMMIAAKAADHKCRHKGNSAAE